MTVILECVDPLGRLIQMHEETWYEKILPVHHELSQSPDDIEQSLTDPDRINRDALFVNRDCFYRRGMLIGSSRHRYLKIVVAFEDEATSTSGRVISAYGTAHYGKAGEQRRWGIRGH